jgi:hypothetical protein
MVALVEIGYWRLEPKPVCTTCGERFRLRVIALHIGQMKAMSMAVWRTASMKRLANLQHRLHAFVEEKLDGAIEKESRL